MTATDDDGATASAATVLLVTNAAAKGALVVGGGALQGVDASVGALVVPFFGRINLGVVSGTYEDARGRHSFGGGLTVDGFKAANGTASWSMSGVLDHKRGAKIAITVTDRGKSGPDHVKLTVTGSDGKVAFTADTDVRAGGFIVR